MNFFEMLVMSKRMAFEDGTVNFYGQGVLIFPSPSMIEYIGLVGGDDENAKELYSTAKEAMLEYKQSILKAYKPTEGIGWIFNTINLYGLGQIRYENQESSLPRIIILENSPFTSKLKGMVNKPIDHILRGIIAGITSIALGKDFDVIEIECSVSENNACKLVLDSKENLMKKFPAFYQSQIV